MILKSMLIPRSVEPIAGSFLPPLYQSPVLSSIPKGLMALSTVFGVALSLVLVEPSVRPVVASVPACPIRSKVLLWSIQRIRSSEAVKPRELSCADLAGLESPDPELLTITTGRISGQAVICISADRTRPCQYVLADISSGADPTAVLADIFAYHQSSSLLNETVERLFIRPAKYIR